MNLLLDTHIIIWFTNGDEKLSEKIKQEITNAENNIFCSQVSLFEIAIKTY
jgi:PIN domain nuclease of toxin-antitoxin system